MSISPSATHTARQAKCCKRYIVFVFAKVRPSFQLNVQSAGNAGDYGGGGGAVSAGGAPALSSGSASSGAQSPGSPPHAHSLPLPQHAHAHAHLAHAHGHQPAAAHHSPRLRTKEEDLSAHGRASADGGGSSESEGECGGGARARAQYVSANCVVFTHYSGDVAAVVDEHFARALSLDKPKGALVMAWPACEEQRVVSSGRPLIGSMQYVYNMKAIHTVFARSVRPGPLRRPGAACMLICAKCTDFTRRKKRGSTGEQCSRN
ncbi:unnamed protein product [Euphydryas editha]|uniref:Protein vestigial n=1 Tax=Euphydryas editha TaxID=104508 RepID=A0AAU9V5Y3_EUPED|nr:unnamed protein product [Euphydryas editha]